MLRGEVSATEAARRVGVAEQTVHNWKRAFVEACPVSSFVAQVRV